MTYERLFFQRLSAEVGIGIIGFGGGLTIYPVKPAPKKFRAYTGVKFTTHAIVDGEHKSVVYVPIGVTLYSRQIINMSMDIGPAMRRHISPGYKPTPACRHRVGYRIYAQYNISQARLLAE